jgi:hypothetical protein
MAWCGSKGAGGKRTHVVREHIWRAVVTGKSPGFLVQAVPHIVLRDKCSAFGCRLPTQNELITRYVIARQP